MGRRRPWWHATFNNVNRRFFVMDIKNLLVDTRTVWVDYPGLEGFSVNVAHLSRKELTALRKRSTVQKFDRKTRNVVETLDDDKFVKEFVEAVVLDWKGLKVKYLETLVLSDTSGKDPESEIEYSKENAETLVKASVEFDNWLNEVVFDLDNFRNPGKN